MTRLSWVIKSAILAGSFMLGMVGYHLLADWPVTVGVVTSVHRLWQLGYSRIGIVLIPLVALSGYLIYLVVGLAGTRDRSFDRHLQFIAEAGKTNSSTATANAVPSCFRRHRVRSRCAISCKPIPAKRANTNMNTFR